ncbi:hypothetical protein C0Q70_15123 [Pomacea canaliculata]|uniref:Uncharacterized protein n=1 Tax=Pomacea canaliculata TaxID=400727 RepID=A0A2T7NTY8_POMCA|nr:hypothetical protein C0Q70_15123 [Pomacea canaliculata]
MLQVWTIFVVVDFLPKYDHNKAWRKLCGRLQEALFTQRCSLPPPPPPPLDVRRCAGNDRLVVTHLLHQTPATEDAGCSNGHPGWFENLSPK